MYWYIQFFIELFFIIELFLLLLLEHVDVKDCSFVIIRYTLFLNLVYIHHTKKKK